MDGNATLRIVLSMVMTRRLSASTARAFQRRGYGAGDIAEVFMPDKIQRGGVAGQPTMCATAVLRRIGGSASGPGRGCYGPASQDGREFAKRNADAVVDGDVGSDRVVLAAQVLHETRARRRGYPACGVHTS